MTGEERTQLRLLVNQARRQLLELNAEASHSYRGGCRCDDCKRAHSTYMRRWYARTKKAA